MDSRDIQLLGLPFDLRQTFGGDADQFLADRTMMIMLLAALSSASPILAAKMKAWGAGTRKNIPHMKNVSEEMKVFLQKFLDDYFIMLAEMEGPDEIEKVDVDRHEVFREE